jgi:hypothetical protein
MMDSFDGFDANTRATERRSANIECRHTTAEGACRAIARWRCQDCERITCAVHIVWLNARPVCASCDQPLTPMMRRSGERRKSAAARARQRRLQAAGLGV